MLLTTDEVKHKIIKIINETVEHYCAANVYIDHEGLAIIADALIKAGISDIEDMKQRHNLLLTAANNFEEKMRVAEARAEIAETALSIAEKLGELCAPAKDYIKIAKKSKKRNY